MTGPADPRVRHWTTCRVCHSRLETVLDLGPVAVSGFPTPDTPDTLVVPLTLTRCVACHLVQLADSVRPEDLYQEYWYRSRVNETMVAELRDLVEHAITAVDGLSDDDWVVDIGANDGTLLAQYPAWETTPLVKVAYEPAANLQADLAATLGPLGSGVIVPQTFPPGPGAYRVPDRRAKIVTSIACFYDLDDPIGFAAEVARILAPDGVWVVQLQDLQQMLETTAFDNICHEHVTYLSLTALQQIADAVGLEVVDAERRAINGGSVRVWIRPQRLTARREPSDRLWALLRAEAGCGTATRLEAFAAAVQRRMQQIRTLVTVAARADLTIDLYAASTKANTLLQVCGLDATVIRQAWERSPAKVGRVTAGTRIPIVSEAAGRAAPPDVLVLGAWQFADAFRAREAAFLAAGGVIVQPLPIPTVITGASVPAGGAVC